MIRTLIAAILCCSPLALADDPLPTLDELLGITDPGTDAPAEDTEDLDRVLSEYEAGEAFQEAVILMDQVAGRLSNDTNLGLDTQRLQESIIRKLDKVIESAQENAGSSGGSSSSSSSSPQEQPDQQQSQQQAEPNPSGQGDQSSTPPGLQEGQLSEAQSPNGVGWGNLPERIRETLTQGLNDTYSDLYRKLTEEYYRALAEDEE